MVETKERPTSKKEPRFLLMLARKGEREYQKALEYTVKWMIPTCIIVATPVAVIIDHKVGHYWPGYVESVPLYVMAQVISRLKYKSLLRVENQTKTD